MDMKRSGDAGSFFHTGLCGFDRRLALQPEHQELMLDLDGRRNPEPFFRISISLPWTAPLKKARQRAGPLSASKEKTNPYFCCSLGLSAGFGGLPCVCCCGVAGAGLLAGFCSVEAEI